MTTWQYFLSHLFSNGKGEAGGMIKWVRVPAIKAQDLSSIPKTHRVEEITNSEELYSDFHVCAMGPGP